MSFFGKDGEESAPSEQIRSALGELFTAHRDVLVVAAAGNRWTNKLTYPAAFPFDQVIAVGAVDESVYPHPEDLLNSAATTPALPPKASFSNYGPWVDAYAPGVMVLGPSVHYQGSTPSFGWSRWSGTSFAAATVTGLLAKAMSGEHPLTSAEARRKVIQGPKIPILGVDPTEWRPYVRGTNSAWPPYSASSDG
jgi:hypothetical protein